MTASPCRRPEPGGRPRNEWGSREHAGEVVPFHALYLGLVAPPLAALITMAMFGARPLGVPLVLATMAPAYLFGFVPAFLVGRLDRSLAERGWQVPARLSVAAGIAGTVGMAILAPLHFTGRLQGAMPLLFPLALAMSAVLTLGCAQTCARLVARARRRRKPGTKVQS